MGAGHHCKGDANGRHNQNRNHPDQGRRPFAGILAIRKRALDLFLHGWWNHSRIAKPFPFQLPELFSGLDQVAEFSGFRVEAEVFILRLPNAVHHDRALAIWRNGSSSARLNAASIAALTLTTEALVDIKEEEMKATGARRLRRHEKKADVRMMSATGKSKSESFDFAGTLPAFRER